LVLARLSGGRFREAGMTTLSINNAIGGLSEGSTINATAQSGVLATDNDPYGYALAVSAVGFGSQNVGISGQSATIQGAYGTLTMHADGSYSFAALSNISLPPAGIVQDKFTFTVTDGHGNTGQAALTITVTQVGVQYVAAAAGQTVTIGNGPTVVDASLGNVTVNGGNGNDVVLGGMNDKITLGNGTDYVIGGTNEKITVGNGSDTISVGAGSTINAGNGADTITAGSNSTVTVGNGNDRITVGNDSSVTAGNGNDTITAGTNSTIAAGNGNDTLSAGAGSTEKAGKYGVVSPTLSVPASLAVNEDGTIAIPIAVTVGPPSETVTVKISGIPADATLRNSSGALTVANGSIVLTQAQLAGLTLIAGEVTSTILNVTATGAIGGVTASTSGTIALTVNPVAPALTLAAHSLSVNAGGIVALGISETPFDPRDTISLTITGVPADASLSAGTRNIDGSWTLAPGELGGLMLHAGTTSTSLTVTATNTAGATAATSQSLALTVLSFTVTTPTISGTAQEGRTLGASVTATGGATVTYAWYSSADGYSSPIGNGATYQVGEGDEGFAIKVKATATSGATTASATSAATAAVLDAAPTITAPTISGTVQEGRTLTASAMAGQSDNPVTYAWYSSADGFATAIANGATYQLEEGDEGNRIDVVATATNDDGVTTSATSAATAAVLDAPPTVTTPTISGTVQEGRTLTASATAGQSDDPVTYAWYSSADGYINPIGTGAAYQLRDSDLGYTIEVKATATNDDGATTTATSAATAAVIANGPPAPTFNLAAADQVGTTATPEAYAGGVELVGRTEAGDTVTLTSGSTVLATTTAGFNGAFTFDNVAIAQGANALTATATNAAGQSTPYSLSIEGLAPLAQPNLVLQWNKTTLDAITLDADPPTVASRNLAMESLAVYDAISAIDGTPGYLVNMAAPAGASSNAAVAAAADAILDLLYPSQAASFDAQLASELAAIPDGQGKTDGVNFGRAVAGAVIALRANDGSSINTTDIGGTGVGVWQPTPPSYATALDPQWANVTPFALTGPDQFLPGGPPALTSQQYADDVALTQSLGAADSTTRTAQETAIAKFWNDQSGTFTPPGQWNAIAATVAAQQGSSTAADARLFAELNVAEADAAIAAWNAKFTYNAWRPVTAIRDADSVGNAYFASAGVVQDPSWISLITTPNFPEYVAGHPTFSAAAARVLDDFFGSDVTFTATSPSLPGTTFTFAPTTLADALANGGLLPSTTTLSGSSDGSSVESSFDLAAQQAGDSRVYGGIHFQFSVDQGLSVGTQVGDWTLAAFDFAQDTVPPKVALDQVSGFVTRDDPTITGRVVTNFGVASLQASLDGGAPVAVAVDGDGTFALPTTLPLDGSADGAHTLSFVATDSDGLQGAQAFSFALATRPPQITLASNGVQDDGTLAAGAQLVGTVTPEPGDAVVAFSYAIDGGTSVPIGFDPASGAFAQAIDLSEVAVGDHTIALTAVDAAGNAATDTLHVSLPVEPTLTIADLTPMAMAMDVGVTYRPKITFSRPIEASTLTGSSFYATDSTGAVVPATIVPTTDSAGNIIGGWMLFDGQLPGASNITLHVVGSLIRGADGSLLDAGGAGTPGSTFTETFSTVSTASVPGTTISGIVVDPGPDDTPMSPDDVKAAADGLTDYANDSWKLPIAGVKVYVLGDEQNAVYTDATGHFTLTNVPVGDVKVEFDGTTATNPPAGYYFPTMVMDLTNVQPGVANTVMGSMGTLQQQAAVATDPAVYLPRVALDILNPVSATAPTTVTAPPDSAFAAGAFALTQQQLSELSLTVQPGSMVDADGNPVQNPQIGISTVPPQLVMDMLPPGLLQHTFDITIQAPGTSVFTTPARLAMPNVFGLAPGEKTFVLSFDHTTGRLVIDGTATVSADGLTVTTDPGAGVTTPGWHGLTTISALFDAAVKFFSSPCGADTANIVSDISLLVLSGALAVPFLAAGLVSPPFIVAGTIAAAGATAYTIFTHWGSWSPQNVNQVIADFGSVISTVLSVPTLFATPAPTGGQVSAWRYWPTDPLLARNFSPGLLTRLGNSEVYGGLTAVFGALVGGFALETDWQQLKKDCDLSGAMSAASLLASPSGLSPQFDSAFGIITSNYNSLTGAGQAVIDSIAPIISTALQPFLPQDRPIIVFASNGVFHGIELNGSDYIDPSTGKPLAISISSLIDQNFFSNQANQSVVQALAQTINDYSTALNELGAATSSLWNSLQQVLTIPYQPSQDELSVQSPDPEDQIFYRVTDIVSGAEIARTIGSAQCQSFVCPPNSAIRVQAFDAATLAYGETVARVPGSGQVLIANGDPSGTSGSLVFGNNGCVNILLESIASANFTDIGADGLPVVVDETIGADPHKVDNFIPGMSDLAALQQGLVTTASLASTTGVVASLPLQGSAQAVALVGSTTNSAQQTAYIATGSYGLAIVDASNFQKPVVLGQIALPGNATGVAVDPVLGLAAVADGPGGLQIVDVADPANPRLAQVIPIDATQVEIIDGVVYANNAGALDAFDLATGTELQTLILGGTVLTGMARDGARLYTMDASRTLRIIDTSSGQMVLDGSISLPFGGNKIFVANGVAYVGAADPITKAGGYLTVDVGNPLAPRLIENRDSPGIAGAALALNGSGLGVSVQEGLSPNGVVDLVSVFNASDPTKTGQFITQYSLPVQPYDVAVGDGIAFVADGTSGLQVVNYESFDTTGIPPTVQVTPPVSVNAGAPEIQLFEGETATVAAAVTDNVQVRNVELLVNGQVATNQVSYPWQLSAVLPTIAANGSDQVTLQVEAIDTGGNTTLSAPIQVQLVPDTTPPLLIGGNVAEGQIRGVSQRAFIFNFSKPLDAASVTASSFSLIGPSGTAIVPASIELQDGGRQVEVTYGSLNVGQYQYLIDASQVMDTAGIALGASVLTTDFTVEPFTDEWLNLTATGSWNVASNWSTGAVPVASDDAYVNLPLGAQVVVDSGSDTVNRLVTSGTGSLAVTGGSLSVTQDAQVSGTLAVSGGTFTANGDTSIGNVVESAGALTGAGTITVGSGMSWSGGALVGSGRTILAAGTTLAVNGSSEILGRSLELDGSVVVFAPGSNLDFFNLYSATLLGGAGTFTVGAGGYVQTRDRGSVFDGTAAAVNLANSGGYGVIVNDNTALTLRGTIDNMGRLQLQPAGNATDLYIDGSVTLQGGGELQFSGNGQGIVTGTSAAATLTNVDNLIDGAGQLGNGQLTLINQAHGVIAGSSYLKLDTGSNHIENFGMIGANVETLSTVDNFGRLTGNVPGFGGGTLLLESAVDNAASGTIATDGGIIYDDAAVTNQGTLEANGGNLFIRNTTLALSSTTEAINGGQFRLYGATIAGGPAVLTTASLGIISTYDRGNVFDGTAAAVNLANSGAYGVEVNDNTALTLRGTIDNMGLIQLQPAGNATDLYIDGNVTLQGGGELQFSGNGQGIVTGTSAAATLTNVDNLIDGAGRLGNGQLTLINQTHGVIAGSSYLKLDTGGNHIENDGTIGAYVETLSTVDNFGRLTGNVSGFGGGALLLESAVNNAASGTIATDGGDVYVDGAVNNLGTLEANGGNLFIRNTTLALSSTTEAVNGGQIRLYGATISGGAGKLDSSGGLVQTYDRGSVLDGTLAAVNLVNNGGYGVIVNDNTALTLRGTIDNMGRILLAPGGNATDLYIDGSVTLEGGGELQLDGNGQGIVTGTSAAATLTNVDNLIDGAGQLGNGQLTLINQASGVIAGSSYLVLNTGSNHIENYGTIGAYVETLSTVDNFGVLTGAVSGFGAGTVLLEGAVNNFGTIKANAGGLYVDGTAVNSGIMEQDANGSLVIRSQITNTGTVKVTSGVLTVQNRITNSSVVESLGATEVLVQNGTIDGPGGGVILASGAGAHVNLNGATIAGNALQTSNGGLIDINGNNNTLDGSAAAVTNSTNLVLNDNSSLTLRGNIDNEGAITSGLATSISIDAAGATLAGGGQMFLRFNDVVGGSGTLTNVDNLIHGSGNLGNGQITLVNQAGGVIEEDSQPATLTINTGLHTIVNAGLIEAGPANGSSLVVQSAVSNSGTLEGNGSSLVLNGNVTNAGSILANGTGTVSITHVTVTGASGGMIKATGSGAHVYLNGVTVAGGTLGTGGGGLIDVLGGNNAFDGSAAAVSNTGSVMLDDNSNATLTLRGTVGNSGSIRVGLADVVNIDAAGAMLTGGGELFLRFNDVVGGSGTLTNVDNLIHGSGNLGNGQITLINQAGGVIEEDSQPATLTIDTGSHTIVNAGLIEASPANSSSLVVQSAVSNSGTLEGNGSSLVLNGNVTNAGSILANGTGTVSLQNGVTSSGNIDANGGNIGIRGVFQASAASSLTIAAGGSIEVGANVSAVAGAVHVGNSATLTGAGTVQANLIDDAFVDVTGGLLKVTGTASGTGSATIESDGTLEFQGTSSLNVSFAAAAGTLQLDASSSNNGSGYTGSIANFGGPAHTAQDHIDLRDISYGAQTTLLWTENGSNTGGILAVGDGTHAANLALLGSYVTANFSMTSDSHGGTLITDPPVPVSGGHDGPLLAGTCGDPIQSLLWPTPIEMTASVAIAGVGQEGLIGCDQPSSMAPAIVGSPAGTRPPG
jgi:hypothetical protein